jgi:uncharacterized SAM-binding protein YcdF (DUF218 family)
MIVRLLAALAIIWALGFAIFAIALPTPADGMRTDAVIVLTGGPGRIQRGIARIEAGTAKRMLISGVDRRVKPHELAAEYGVPRRLFDRRVDLGTESFDTRTNADESGAWLRKHRYRSVRLITTDWHMPRARYELSRVVDPGVLVIADPVPSTPGLTALLAEYNKYLLRRITAPFGL